MIFLSSVSQGFLIFHAFGGGTGEWQYFIGFSSDKVLLCQHRDAAHRGRPENQPVYDLVIYLK